MLYIDDFADQTVGIATTSLSGIGAEVGFGVTAALSGAVIPGSGTTSEFTGFLKGIITGLTTDASGNSSTIDVKVVSRVETVGGGSTETKIDYAEGTSFAAFGTGTALNIVNNSGVNTTGRLSAALTPATAVDWYDQQTLGLTNSTLYWKTIAPRPISSNYVTDRNGKNDGIHIAVVDDDGSITGIKGNLLESHTNLSKAGDAVSDYNAPTKNYYKDYIADFSKNVYAGYNLSSGITTSGGSTCVPRASGFSTDFTAVTTGDGLFGLDAQDVTFSVLGNKTFTLGGGVDYSATKDSRQNFLI